MTPAKLDKYQNVFIALFFGIVIPPLVAFGTHFWTTSSAAERRTNDALLAARTSICVAQFSSAPDYQQRLKELKPLDSTAKSAYFEKGGWSKMPGDDQAQKPVTEACASKLDELAKKS